jgi:ferredoxin-NADP reductase/MOSC domain-containing protein YiiM/ferredoxin
MQRLSNRPRSERSADPPAVVGRLLSVNVGRPREVRWNGHTIRTSVWKDPVEGRRAVRRINIDGDEQADLAAHGGEHRAVFVYQVDSYHYWERELARDDLEWGQFGENFTVEGLADDEVCIGDRYRIGDAIFEVTQPRVTCFRVGLRMEEPRMPSLLVAHHRPGFYFRVIKEGEVGAGDPIERLEVGPEQLTIADVDALLYLPHKSTQALERALRIPALSDGWKDSFRAMRDRGSAANASPAAWQGFAPMRVTAVHRESAVIVSLTLRPSGNAPVAAKSAPGQYLTLRLHPSGSDGPAVIRSYSLSKPAGRGGYRISVKLEQGGVCSTYLQQQVHAGDTVEAAAPRGNFVLREGDRPVVLISAGVGVTPVLAMLHKLASTRERRTVWWLHGARNSADHAFGAEVDRLLKRLPDARRMVFYSQPDPGDVPGRGFDDVGRITVEGIAAAGIPVDADYYICGPDAFMRSLSAGLASRGTAPEQIGMELFGAGAVIAPPGMQGKHPAPHPPKGTPGTGAAVTFSRSSLTVPWDPDFGNLLDFAEACDVPVSFSCRQGVCHYCESGLLSGAVDYVRPPLETPDSEHVLVCCAAPAGEITLEL